MKGLYLDSSVVVALLLKEPGSRRFVHVLEGAIDVFSASLLEAEVSATAVREKIPLETARPFIDLTSLVLPDRNLRGEYDRIFKAGFCRGADACHIATALYLDPPARNLTFVTADKNQARIAKVVGFRLAG